MTAVTVLCRLSDCFYKTGCRTDPETGIQAQYTMPLFPLADLSSLTFFLPSYSADKPF